VGAGAHASGRPEHWKIPESVLVVIHTRDLDVLLLERVSGLEPGVPYWQSVTGAKDRPDEPFEAAARREVFEETGIDCRVGSPLESRLRDWGIENVYPIYPQWRHRYAPEVVFNVERVFGLTLDAPVAVRLSPTEHRHAVWLPWRAAADRCASSSNAEAILMLPRFLENADDRACGN
jgi:dATP pyrophosphohydrolase